MATVGKKFVDPDKWEQPFYVQLQPEYKLIWCYMWERCNHAGMILFVPEIWTVHIGVRVNEKTLDEFMIAVNTDKIRLIEVSKNKLWIPHYIKYQQKDEVLNPRNNFHKHIQILIEENDLKDVVSEYWPKLLKNLNSEGSCKGLAGSLSKSSSKGNSLDGGSDTSNNNTNSFKNFSP